MIVFQEAGVPGFFISKMNGVMKKICRIFFVCVAVCLSGSVFGQTDSVRREPVKKVAFIEMRDAGGEVIYGMDLMLRGDLTEKMKKCGYELYECASADTVAGTQNFLRMGVAEDRAKIKKLGKLMRAANVLVIEQISLEDADFFIKAKIFNVEIGRFEEAVTYEKYIKERGCIEALKVRFIDKEGNISEDGCDLNNIRSYN